MITFNMDFAVDNKTLSKAILFIKHLDTAAVTTHLCRIEEELFGSGIVEYSLVLFT